MASRPLPPGRRGRGVRSAPARQNLPQPTLLSIDTAAPTPAASKWTNPARSPLMEPAVAPKIEDPPHAAAITPAPVVEKKRATSSVFQSARAVFEAKQAATAGHPPPPPPPIRRRVTSPNRPAVVAVVKEQPVAPDFSSSTCSTVDSEGDREPKDIVDVPVEQHETKPTSWKRPVVSEMREERTTVSAAAAHVIAKAPYSAPRSAPPVPLNPPVVTYSISPAMPAPVTAAAERVEGNQLDGGEIHPFRLLLPVDAIPTLPDEIACVYDAAAVEMQKNVMKVVRKLLKKDKLRLDEFKVNARLFGNDFMDAHEYLDTLVKDFGGIRTLQLVPCLLSIQPDMMKRNALLLVAKNYKLRNEKQLERQCQALRSTSETNTPTKVEMTVSSVGSTPQGKSLTRVETPPPVLKVDAKAALASEVATTPAVPSEVPGLASLVVETTANLVQAATSDPTRITLPIEPASTTDFEPVAEPFAPVPVVAKASAVIVETAPTQDQPSTSELIKSPSTSTGGDAMAVKAVAANEVVVSKAVDVSSEPPKEEPSVLARAKATPHIAVSTTNESSQVAMVAAPPVKVSTAVPVGKEHPPSATPSDSEDDGFQAENLFGEPIKPAPQLQKNAEMHAAISSASPSQSFDDAVNLFGERVAVASGPAKSTGKKVTWGEPQSVEAPAPPKHVRKPAPAPMIFGFATAGAYADDSDSDDSDFSD